MSDLLLKATPELLHRWCGPVTYQGEQAALLFGDAEDDNWTIAGLFDDFNDVEDRLVSSADLYLDLAREECRDRVARVLAARFPAPGAVEYGAILCGIDNGYLWIGDFDIVFAAREIEDDRLAAVVPALAGIIERNGRAKLPDGSSRAVAEALLVVAGEVLR